VHHPMFSLSAQLLVYAAAWLMLGLGFQLNRRVAVSWSIAWFCAAGGALLLLLEAQYPSIWLDVVVNLLIISSFVLLQRGVDAFTGKPVGGLGLVAVYSAGLLAIEGLRQLGPDWLVLHVTLFTLLICWPLGATALQILRWLRLQGRTSTAVALLTVSPLGFVILIFVTRWVLVLSGTATAALRFNQSGDFDLLMSLAFLLLLGGFNFSLASLVVGRLISMLRSLSDTDQLTGLFNRRMMMRRLDNEYARHRRSGPGFSMLMLDIDHFKRINDTYGHGVGDQVLVGLARVLSSCTRQTDTLARTGGEEFMLLMPQTDSAGALVRAQRLCDAVANARLATDSGELAITISVGAATVQVSDQTDDRLVSRADAALYRAKEGGRNRVEVDSGTLPAEPAACPAKSF
jgi:diguanylate cyclase (GGDEF)-like protein